METTSGPMVSFTAMADGTREDYEPLARLEFFEPMVRGVFACEPFSLAPRGHS